MCGFVGYLLTEAGQQPDLDAWSTCIRHRGPDQAGHASHLTFGVGTRRLSILDLSAAGDQPMESGRYVLAFNGEVYNHLEIRAELRAAGVGPFRSGSDTETILRAVEQWGITATLARLNGMFSLAIWDKARAELTLARDPLGVKPLLYVSTAQGTYFASELKALRRFTPGRVSGEGVALFLLLGFVPAPFSLLQQARKVRPGEALVFGRAGVTRRRIVPRAWTRPPGPAPRRDEQERLVRREVEAAVRRQLLADVPVGLFLSGGVDSSIIAAVAAAHKPDLRTFSIRPAEAFADPGAQEDAEIAARFARSLGLSHHELLVHPDQVWDELDSLATSMDEPVSELYFAAEVLLSWAARTAGVPVVLTGHGADEVFLGYPTYQAVSKGDRYNAVPLLGPTLRTLAGLPLLAPGARQNLRGAASVWRRSPADRYAIVSAVHFSLPEVAALTDLPPTALSDLLQQVLDETQAASADLPRSRPLTTAEWFARMDLLLKVPEHYNMRLDRATMVASVEARVPFQDLDLIGSVMRLPAGDLLRGGPKGLLRRAFRDVLPDEVVRRRKQTFQAPVLSWVRGPLAPWLSTQLAQLPAPLRAALPAKDLLPRSTGEAYRLWCLGLLEAWRTALDLSY